MKKQELRVLYKQKRNNLSVNQIIELQDNIYQQVYSLNYSGVKVVHLFLSLTKFKEIDTQPIINFLRKQNIKIVVSKSNLTDNTLSHYYLEENTILELNKFGVPEPVNAVKVDEQELDLVFVPMLISDELNYRVGYGKGFYDRFLLKCREDAKFIGLNFFKPIYQIEDSNDFDVPLHQVIYPK